MLDVGIPARRGQSARGRSLLGVLCLALVLAVSAALPADAQTQAKSGKESGKEGGNDIPEVPGDEIFGFSAGTDTGDKGDRGFANELNGFHGKRFGSYTALSNKMEFSATPADNLWLAASAFVANNYINNVAGDHSIHGGTGIPNINKTQFEGFSAEAQYRLITRSASNPFAFAVAIEPFRSWIDLATGQRSDSYGAAFKLLADAVIVPDRIYWAVNAIWAPVRSQDIEDRSVWLSTSGASLQTAVAFQLSKSLFIGAEWRHLAAYDGTWFDGRVGYANYFGPTFLWKITDKIAFNTTWQPQISGRSIDNPTLRYDLDNFERAQFRFKLVVELN